MAIRNGWRRGDHLVQDDGTGATIYASEARVLWNGTIQHRDHYETRQPQEFVRALHKDPYAEKDVRAEVQTSAVDTTPLVTVGLTNVKAPTGAASHLYDIGIGSMSVGPNGSFIVR